MKNLIAAIAVALALILAFRLVGQRVEPEVITSGDWPMWRFDAQRRAATPMGLASDLRLQWVREMPAPRRAWPVQPEEEDKTEFDASYSPIAYGRHLFVASMTDDTLTSYDTRTGRKRWSFRADGPMRFAPVAHAGRVYVGSDDGHLYCLATRDGSFLWKIRGGPEDRRLLGNERLISMWPIRGAPVLRDGTLYFAASIWPLMGTFIYSVDAVKGETVWLNSGSGLMYNQHQHSGAHAFGGVAPQGYMAVSDDALVVSGGRTIPAVYDRDDGEFRYFRQATDIVGKGAGGYRIGIQSGWFYNHRFMYSLEDGAQFLPIEAVVLTDQAVYDVRSGTLRAFAPEPQRVAAEVPNRLGQNELRKMFVPRPLWSHPVEGITALHMLAGDRLYGSGEGGRIFAFDLPREGASEPSVSWEGKVDGEVWEMLAADDRLFVVTRDGRIHCFGSEETELVVHGLDLQPEPKPVDDEWGTIADRMLSRLDDDGGYAFVVGIGRRGRLVEELLARSSLYVIAVDASPKRVKALQDRLSASGLYGRRASAHVGNVQTFPFPKYMADLIVVDDRGAGVPSSARVFDALRPYGGIAWIRGAVSAEDKVRSVLAEAKHEGFELATSQGSLLIKRPGPLAGAGSWTHQYANSSNTTFSTDALVRAPLGLLWFGGPSNSNALPRHANGPIPHVVGGRLFVLGVNTISARDVYTGRELWVKPLPGVGNAFTSLSHEEQYLSGKHVYMPVRPGANFVGSPYVSLEDGIYLVHGDACLRLDPRTGATVSEFRLPPAEEGGQPGRWGRILIHGDLLIAAADPQAYDDREIGDKNWNGTSSDRLVVMDRHSGKVLWQRRAGYGFRHNAIAAGRGRVFVIDGLSSGVLAMLERRGESVDAPAVVLALDARTGLELWGWHKDVQGTWLGYSEEHDILIQSGRAGGRDTLEDEPRASIVAHGGMDGVPIWTYSGRYSGPLAIHADKITGGRDTGAFDLLTGQVVNRRNPLTGIELPWGYSRTYGCGTQNASTHLLTFRSGAAGFADLLQDAGTSNLGGFRAGCTNNLVVADGVLNAPDYTRTCSCAYQNQTSVALVHMPEVEMWTYNNFSRGPGAIQRLGLNLAAPGNHTHDGVLWLNHPAVGGASPKVPVKTEGEARGVLLHSSLVSGGTPAPAWVAASALEGLEKMTVELVPPGEVSRTLLYTVRLHFAELADAAEGERVFSVSLQGEVVAPGLDIVATAGGPRRAMVLEFSGIEVAGGELTLDLAKAESSRLPTILSGMEIVLESPR